MKTIVLGFDALDFRYLDRFEDSLPHFNALRERGVGAPLESTHPPWTGSAWPSMYTGTDPSHHGVYGFFRYDDYPDDGELVTRGDVERPAIWDYLSSEDGRSIVVNVPITHPADPIEGTLIPGYLAPEDEPGHPRGIRDELEAALDEPYTIYSDGEISDDPDEKFDGYLELIHRRRRAALELLESQSWEFGMIQVQKTDAVFHNFDDEDRFREIYVAADRLLGDVLDLVDEETNVIVCSDHGMGRTDGYTVYVNEILRQHGFVETASEDGRPTLETRKSSLLTGGSESGDSPSAANESGIGPLERTMVAGQRLAGLLGVQPSDAYAVAERLGLGPTLVRLTPEAVRKEAAESVNWRDSIAFCPDSTRLGVRINLADRESAGVVSPTEYETVRGEIIDLFRSLETPDGEPAFEMVRRREDVFDGPFVDRAPDVLFRPTGMNHVVSETVYGRAFVPVAGHDHKRDGVFLAAGPSVAATGSLDRLSLSDVAPIAMAALDRPVPERMTGAVPDGLLTGDERRSDYGTVPYGNGDPASTEDEAVTDRLEGLGYL